MPGAPEKERFKIFFEQGDKLYKQGEYGAAIWNFRRADAVLATPEVIYDLAKCFEKLGDAPFATFYYRLYLKRAPTASDTLDVAERVGTALSHNESEGRGFLEVVSPGADKLTVNGRVYPESPVAVFLAPGEYEVTGTFPGGVRTTVAQVRTGKTTSLLFEPVSPPLLEATPGAPDEALDVGEDGVVKKGPKKLRVAAWVTGALGVAAVATGSVLGIISAGQASELERNRAMPVTEAQKLANAANANALYANVLWIGGGALVGGGVLMFVFSMPEPGMQGSGGSSP
jgi:hypothetical protein